MIKNSKWNDAQLEEHLRKMPHLEDHRSQEEIYQSISSKIMNEHKNHKHFMIPVFAAGAVVILLFVLVPTLFHQHVLNSSQKNGMVAMDNSANMPTSKKPDKSVKEKQMNTLSTNSIAENNHSFVVKEDQVTNHYLITIGLPVGDAANVVPVSVLIPKESGSSKITELQNVLKIVSFKDLGFSPSRLKDATFKEKNPNEIIMDVTNEKIDQGISSEQEFLLSVQETFRWMGYKEVWFYNKNGKKLELSDYGPIDHIQIRTKAKKGFFIYKTKNNQKDFLAPSSEAYSSFKDALRQMRKGVFHLLPSIPKDVHIAAVAENGNHVIVTFSKNSKLTDNTNDELMLYAIMLTAREFGYQYIKFSGLQVGKVGEVNMNVENKVPIAPNLIQLP